MKGQLLKADGTRSDVEFGTFREAASILGVRGVDTYTGEENGRIVALLIPESFDAAAPVNLAASRIYRGSPIRGPVIVVLA